MHPYEILKKKEERNRLSVKPEWITNFYELTVTYVHGNCKGRQQIFSRRRNVMPQIFFLHCQTL